MLRCWIKGHKTPYKESWKELRWDSELRSCDAMPNSPADTPNEIVGPNMHRESLENKGESGGGESYNFASCTFSHQNLTLPSGFPSLRGGNSKPLGQIVMGVQGYSQHSSSVRSPELRVCVRGGHLSLLFFLLLTIFSPSWSSKGI